MDSQNIEDCLRNIAYIPPRDNATIEVELRFINKTKDLQKKKEEFRTLALRLMKSLTQTSPVITQSINGISNNKVKSLIFINGVQQKSLVTHYEKVPIVRDDIILSNEVSSARLSVKYEVKTDEFPLSACTMARIRFRFTYELSPWKIEITLVKNVTDLTNPQVLKAAKESMLYSITSDVVSNAPWDVCDSIEIEAEHIDTTHFKVEDLRIVSTLFDVEVEDYQGAIYAIAKKIHATPHKFAEHYGIKNLSNQVIELDKNTFIKNVLPSITNYYIGNKLDGKRTLLHASRGKLYAVNDTLQVIQCNGNFIADAEFYDGVYWIFDVMWYDDEDITSMSWVERKKLIDKCCVLDCIKEKPFERLTSSFAKQIIKWKTQTTQVTDGIIFTPAVGGYFDMTVYKYKPAELLTIDMLIRRAPDELAKKYKQYPGQILYWLFVGCNDKVFHRLKLKKIVGYSTLFPTTSHSYFPLQYEAPDDNLSYVWYSSDDSLDNNIGEFALASITTGHSSMNDNSLWTLHKIRTDRAVEAARGNYFGNNIKVADAAYMSLMDPLIVENITTENYFVTNDNSLYKNSRSFNSYVKTQLQKYLHKKIVVDCASGKGQDLFRYAAAGVQHLICAEIDVVALQELISRKHDFATSRDSHSMKINAIQVDFLKPTDDIMEKLSRLEFTQHTATSVVCHFAIHYFAESIASMDNYAATVSSMLEPGGTFICTAFNGESVKKIANDTFDLYQDDTLQYSIKRTGDTIEVLLPFSNGNYYKEYLVYTDSIRKIFSKYNLSLTYDESFATFLPSYKGSMTPHDITYCSLYHAWVFTKTTA